MYIIIRSSRQTYLFCLAYVRAFGQSDSCSIWTKLSSGVGASGCVPLSSLARNRALLTVLTSADKFCSCEKAIKYNGENRHTTSLIRSCGVKCQKKLTLLSAAEAESAMYIFAAASKSSSSCKCSLYRALPNSKIDSSFE